MSTSCTEEGARFGLKEDFECLLVSIRTGSCNSTNSRAVVCANEFSRTYTQIVFSYDILVMRINL